MSNTSDPGKSLTNETSTRTGLSIEELFDILSKRERQFTALLLTDRDGPVSLDELVTHIASQLGVETDRFDTHRERIYIDLCHCHLPKLLDVEVVEYDDRYRIKRGKNFEELTPALELIREEYSSE